MELLRLARGLVSGLAFCNEGEAECRVKEAAENAGAKTGDLLTPLRAALTGARISPPLFGSIRLLGAQSCLSRIDRALAAYGQNGYA
jgi:glutamyl-tRNA synthetase